MPSLFVEMELYRQKSVCGNMSLLSNKRFPQKTKEVTIDYVPLYRLTKELQWKLVSMTTTTNTNTTNNASTVSATLTILTKCRRVCDPDERWTAQKIRDELVLDLSNIVGGKAVYNPALYPNGVSEEIQEKYRQGIDYPFKYRDQARKLLYRIPVYRPTPRFIIYRSDLDRKVKGQLRELKASYTNKEYQDIISSAVDRIFQSINYSYFHLSIAGLVKWRIEP